MTTPQTLAAAVAADPDDPASAAAAMVHAYCTRGIPDPPPMVVVVVTRALALRLAANPTAMRGVSAEGQSVQLPTLGLTYMESTLLGPYRRKSA